MTSSLFDIALALGHFATVATIVFIILYLVLGFDDVLSDIYFWIRRSVRNLRFNMVPELTLEKLDAFAEQRIAVFVPCWREAEVVGRMIGLLCPSIRYTNFDVFVGVYPNDQATQAALDGVRNRFSNVHMIVNPSPGPTTKGQNLNAMFEGLKAVEGDRPFAMVVLHDVEDVVHPLSFKLYNYLIPRKDMVQLPVFPLERPAANWTAWTYADEFAENHQKDLLVRESSDGFVPGAGVGCAYGRRCLDAMFAKHNGRLFRADALTEDYQFGLELKLNGFESVFVHQRIQIPKSMDWRFSAAGNFIATRAFFPFTFRSAARQKSRWVAGICFQAASMTGWKGNPMTRYNLYRDRKSVVADFVSMAAYPVLLLVAGLYLWRWYDSAVPVPRFTDPVVVAGLWVTLSITLFRLIQRACFVGTLYGRWQALASIPRTVWGNVINGSAALAASWQVCRARVRNQPLVWVKTSHHFPHNMDLPPQGLVALKILPEASALPAVTLPSALETDSQPSLVK